jgi:hypothetical protein
LIGEDPSVFLEAFRSLFTFTSARGNWADGWDKRLKVTKDFVQTIKSTSHLDSYMNPVNWVLSTTKSEDLIVISPFEANGLITDIVSSEHVRLHIYSPKVTNTMKSFEDLSFLTLPYSSSVQIQRPLIEQLNLFAGQFFLQDYAAYRDLCRLLSLHADPNLPAGKGKANNDRFVAPDSREALGMGPSLFNSSPVAFLMRLMGLRRKGQDYGPTHMGKLLHGQLLNKNDP